MKELLTIVGTGAIFLILAYFTYASLGEALDKEFKFQDNVVQTWRGEK